MPAIPLVSRPAARVGVFLGEVNSPKNKFDLFCRRLARGGQGYRCAAQAHVLLRTDLKFILPAEPAKLCEAGRSMTAPTKAHLTLVYM